MRFKRQTRPYTHYTSDARKCDSSNIGVRGGRLGRRRICSRKRLLLVVGLGLAHSVEVQVQVPMGAVFPRWRLVAWCHEKAWSYSGDYERLLWSTLWSLLWNDTS